MGNVPVLKPNEVTAILTYQNLASPKSANAVHTNNSAIPPVAAQRCRFIKVETSPPILLRQVAKDIGLALDELLKHR